MSFHFVNSATYLFARHLGRNKDGSGGEAAGLWAALFVGIAPGMNQFC